MKMCGICVGMPHVSMAHTILIPTFSSCHCMAIHVCNWFLSLDSSIIHSCNLSLCRSGNLYFELALSELEFCFRWNFCYAFYVVNPFASCACAYALPMSCHLSYVWYEFDCCSLWLLLMYGRISVNHKIMLRF